MIAALALASGLVWLLLLPTTAPPEPDPTARAVAGPIALQGAAPAPQPPPVIEAPAACPGPESDANVAAPETPPGAAPAAPNSAAPSPPATTPGDRVLLVALGNAAPAVPSTAAPLRLANRTVPIFPVEAIRAGIQSGRVVARLTVETDGRASALQIVSTSPPGYFERESRRALATWRYEPPGQATLVDVELVFKRE